MFEQEMIPFAVVGSDQEYQVNGRRLLGRKTKWGTIEGTTLSFFSSISASIFPSLLLNLNSFWEIYSVTHKTAQNQPTVGVVLFGRKKQKIDV